MKYIFCKLNKTRGKSKKKAVVNFKTKPDYYYFNEEHVKLCSANL